MKNARLYILLLTLTLSTLFLFVPKSGKVGFVLNDDIKLQWDTWVWLFTDKLAVVGICWVLYMIEPRFKLSAAVFMTLQILDAVFWVLAYSDPLKPLSFNVLKLLIFLWAIVKDYGRSQV